MTFEEFREFQYNLLQEVILMGETKGKEYANGYDRFGNFNRLSERLGMSNLKVAYIYLTKHLDAIESYIKTGETHSNESIRGRLVDAITYLTLIAGMIREDEINPIIY